MAFGTRCQNFPSNHSSQCGIPGLQEAFTTIESARWARRLSYVHRPAYNCGELWLIYSLLIVAVATMSEGTYKQIDLTYKNLIEKFGPSARQLITAGKSHLKALHAAVASSKAYLDAISNLSLQAEQSPFRTSSNVGECLKQIVGIQKEVELQQTNALNAFYIDFIVALESNLEKDRKSLQNEHQVFCSSFKTRQEAYSKAAASVKRRKKRRSGVSSSIDKDIKCYQTLAEERTKLEEFIEESIKNVTVQEHRRYGFILDRLCSVSKHNLSFYTKGSSLLHKHLDSWSNTASAFNTPPDEIYSSPETIMDGEENSRLIRRRAQSLDGFIPGKNSHEDFHLMGANSPTPSVCRSELNLEHSGASSVKDYNRRLYAKVVHSFITSCENQLNFNEEDTIYLIGNANKGWQFGENIRTHLYGWFPVSYINEHTDESDSALSNSTSSGNDFVVDRIKSRRNDSRRSSFSTWSNRSTNCRSRSKIRANQAASYCIHSSSSSSSTFSNSIRSSVQSHLNKNSQDRSAFSSSFDKDRQFDSFNSHSFSSPYKAEEQSAEKYTSLAASSLSPSFCRSLTSPDLPSCFRKSVSSKESLEYSEDSGFNNDELQDKKFSPSYPISENYNKSVGSNWISAGGNYSSQSFYNQSMPSSPTFLQYLYPSKGAPSVISDSGTCRELISVDKSKEENWMSTVFGKKRNPMSACSRKIANQKAKRTKGKDIQSALNNKRNASLLCLDITSCSGKNEEDSIAANYEDILYCRSWRHESLMNIDPRIPPAPAYNPPSPPDKTKKPLRKLRKLNAGNSLKKINDSSSMNSDLIINDQDKNEKENVIKNGNKKSFLCRSFTWASKDAKNSAKLSRKLTSLHQSSMKKLNEESINTQEQDEAPPLPPRTHTSFYYRQDETPNILNYSEFMSQRLQNPNGSCALDQRSFTTGHQCTAWYDLWKSDD